MRQLWHPNEVDTGMRIELSPISKDVIRVDAEGYYAEGYGNRTTCSDVAFESTDKTIETILTAILPNEDFVDTPDVSGR